MSKNRGQAPVLLALVATNVTPAATVGDSADLLDVQVNHVAGAPSDNLPRFAVTFPGRVDEAAPVELQVGEDATHRAPTDLNADLFELERDPSR